MPDYTPEPLPEKLGLKPGLKMVVINAPTNYAALLGELPPGVTITDKIQGRSEFIHYFATDQEGLGKFFPTLKGNLPAGGALWISWPKKNSPLFTGLNEHMVRNIGLRSGLIEIKGCEIDKNWSSMKFMYRLNPRKQERKPTGPITANSRAKEVAKAAAKKQL